jgi:hypothetical protein
MLRLKKKKEEEAAAACEAEKVAAVAHDADMVRWVPPFLSLFQP